MTSITWTNIRVKLGDLISWADNPRQSTKKQAKRLLASWEQFGQVQTVAIDPEGNVLDGHQRLSALLTVHGKAYEIDARQSSRALSEDERRQLVVTLHAGAVGSWSWDALSSWDAGKLMTWGLDDDLFREWKTDAGALGNLLESEKPEPVDADVDMDRAAELQKKWGVESGMMFALGDHRIICGDCTDPATVARVMQGEKAAFSVTSPPYPGAEMWETEGEKLIKIGNDCLLIMRDVVEPGCAIAWNTSDIPCGQVGVQANPARDTMAALSMGWTKRAEIVWEKGLSYLPAPWNTRRPTVPNSTHELVLIFYNGERLPREKEGNLDTDALLWNRESVWRISPAKASDENHVAPFPAELAERCITLFSFIGDVIYDPFAGSGTTGIACHNLGRRARMIEIAPKYCAVILQRFVDAFPGIEIERIWSN